MPVKIEADIKNTFHDDTSSFNVVGEIPGTDKADESRDARRALRLVARRAPARPTTPPDPR